MATKKTIFVAFAIEDERQRDFLKGQSLERFNFEMICIHKKVSSSMKATVAYFYLKLGGYATATVVK